MQVNDLDSDSSMTRATSLGYLRYPPTVLVANAASNGHANLTTEQPLMSFPFLFVPSFATDDSRIELQHANQHVGSSSLQVGSIPSLQFQMDANEARRYDHMVSPMETYPAIHTGSQGGMEDTAHNHFPGPSGTETGAYDPTVDAMETDEMQPVGRDQHGSSTNLDAVGGVPGYPGHIPNHWDLAEYGQFHHFLPYRDPSGWELPFLKGWLMGQSQAGRTPMLPLNDDGGNREQSAQYVSSSILPSHMLAHNVTLPGSISVSGISGRSGLRHHFSHPHLSGSESMEGGALVNAPHDRANSQPIISGIQSEITTSIGAPNNQGDTRPISDITASLAATTAAELPCTVKLRVWSHDVKNPCTPLSPERCCLTIPHAVLCR